LRGVLLQYISQLLHPVDQHRLDRVDHLVLVRTAAETKST
jgi:hypothetical protein